VLRRGAHRELVHVGLAEDRQSRGAQPADQRGVVGRHPALEDLAAAGRRQAARGHDVLDGDRHPGQQVDALAGGATLVDVLGGAQGALGVDVQVGVHGTIHLGGPVEVGAGQLDGADLLGGQQARHLGGAEPGQVGGHVCSQPS
jgi:hypothetical protein